MNSFKTVKDVDVTGKKVLLRVAYDISLKEEDGKWIVPDNSRIVATLPTIKYLLEKNCAIVLVSWLKRPDGKVVEKYRLDPVAEELSRLLEKPVEKIDECVGETVRKVVDELQQGELLMLENTRFHAEENNNDSEFAKQLTYGCDLMVFDAFAQVHRTHASTVAIFDHIPAVSGLLLESELGHISKIIEKPERPLAVILGGAKISDKVEIVKNLLNLSDIILIGGAMANNFLKEKGIAMGRSLVEDVSVNHDAEQKSAGEVAKELMESTKGNKPDFQADITLEKIQLPLDMVSSPDETGEQKEVVDVTNSAQSIKDDWAFYDIGPKSVELFCNILKQAKTIFWNGPVGLFEKDDFDAGTKKLAFCLAEHPGTTIVGGGDTKGIVRKYDLEGKFTHISTGGGSFLELLAGKGLPALEALKKNQGENR